MVVLPQGFIIQTNEKVEFCFFFVGALMVTTLRFWLTGRYSRVLLRCKANIAVRDIDIKRYFR